MQLYQKFDLIGACLFNGLSKLQSVGSLCVVNGKYTTDDNVAHNFSWSLDCASTFQVQNEKNFARVIALHFPDSSPIDKIVLEIMTKSNSVPASGKNEAANDDLYLVRAVYTFRRYEDIQLTGHHAITDVTIDKITLACFEVELPTQEQTNNASFLSNSLCIVLIGVVFGWSLFSFLKIGPLPLIAVLVLVTLCCATTLFTHLHHSRINHSMSFFVSGWNAWSYCGAVRQGSKLALYSVPSVIANAFHDGGVGSALPVNSGRGTAPRRTNGNGTTRPVSSDRDFLASDMFTMLGDVKSKHGVVLGFLSQKQHFGCIAVNRAYDRLSVHLSCDGVVVSEAKEMATDWLAIYFTKDSLEDPFDRYMRLSSQENKVRERLGCNNGNCSDDLLPAPPTGWSSCYTAYDSFNRVGRLTEARLSSNIAALQSLRTQHGLTSSRADSPLLNVFQVDDGFQTAWGDWTVVNPLTFSSKSLGRIAAQIRDAGLIGGIWLAPFCCDKNSQITKHHPEWVLRRSSSSSAPSNSANCGKWFCGLDVTNPQAAEFVRQAVVTVTRIWGFGFLKLDFLYAAALGGDNGSTCLDRTLTRAQVMQRAMDIVSKVCLTGGKNDVFVLGCGAPLGSVIGHVHANRVSADTGPTWDPAFPLPSTDKWNIPCARNMIRNTLTRLFMHGHWWTNDPDCLLLRDSLPFSETEIRAIATVKALSGGSLFVSDDLQAVSPRRLRIAMQLLPPTNVAAMAVDLLDRETPELLRLKLSSVSSTSCVGHLHFEWTMFCVCNWSDSLRNKSHSLSLSQLFGQDTDVMVSSDRTRKYLLHKFDFWDQRYSYEVVTAGSAVTFDRIPRHGLQLVSISLQTDLDVPKYLGSTLHFSCGKELRYFFSVPTPQSLTDAAQQMLSPGNTGNVVSMRSVFLSFHSSHFKAHSVFAEYVWLFLPVGRSVTASDVMRSLEVSGRAVKSTPARNSVESVSAHPVSAATLVCFVPSGTEEVKGETEGGVRGAVWKVHIHKGDDCCYHNNVATVSAVEEEQEGSVDLTVSWVADIRCHLSM